MDFLKASWLEQINKISGAKATAIALAFGVFLWMSQTGVVPTLSSPWIHIVWLCFLLSSFIAVISGVTAFASFIPVHRRLRQYFQRRGEVKKVRDYIPYMNETEKVIIGYLLHHNQQSFNCAADGGHASTLLGRGIIKPAMIQGQLYTEEDMPMTIMPHIWKELEKNKSDFPYNSPPRGKVEPHPWRVHWMS